MIKWSKVIKSSKVVKWTNVPSLRAISQSHQPTNSSHQKAITRSNHQGQSSAAIISTNCQEQSLRAIIRSNHQEQSPGAIIRSNYSEQSFGAISRSNHQSSGLRSPCASGGSDDASKGRHLSSRLLRLWSLSCVLESEGGQRWSAMGCVAVGRG